MNDTPEHPPVQRGGGNAAEPCSAILAEMRDRADTIINGRAITERNFVPQETVEDWADRIEAAAKRERVEIRRDAEIEWTRIGYDERKAEEKRAPGNAAVMRAALERAVDAIDAMCALYDEEHTSAVAIGAKWKHEDMTEVVAILASARAALSAPARNCDRAKDAAEDLFKERFGRPWTQAEDELAAWLFAPMTKNGENEQ